MNKELRRKCYNKTTFRIIVVILGLLHVFFLGGVLFGWSSMSIFLEENEIYLGLCPTTEICQEQIKAIYYLFTVGSFCFSITALPAGYLIDKFGGFISSAIGDIFIIVGLLFFAFAPENPEMYLNIVNELIMGSAMMMSGGMIILLSTYRLYILFRRRTGLIIGLVNMFFDASALIPFIFLFANQYLSRSIIFSAYIIVPVVFCIISPIWGTKRRYLSEDVNNLSLVYLTSGNGITTDETVALHLAKSNSFYSHITSFFFIVIVLFFSINNVSLNFYLASVNYQISNIIEDDSQVGSRYVSLFSLILPFASLFSFVIGWIIDKRGILLSLWIVITVGLFGFSIALIPVLPAQIATFILLSCYRPMLYTVTTNYIAILFGIPNFGRLYGVVMFINGVLNLLQYPLLLYALGDYGSFFYINIFSVTSLFVCYLFPIFVHLRSYYLKQT